MRELMRTNDPVKLSWLVSLLADSGIDALVFDTHTSILEGSLGVLPRRLMVTDDSYESACRLLRNAGEEPYEP